MTYARGLIQLPQAKPPQLKFGAYFKGAELPPVPAIFPSPSLFQLLPNWGMLSNDTVGDCVWAGAAHETMLLSAMVKQKVPFFTSRGVLADYSAVTGYKTTDPSTDQGTDIVAAAAYRQKTGIADAFGNRYKIGIYTGLPAGDLDKLARAIFTFGAVGIAVNLPSSADDQFNMHEPFHLVSGDKPSGGHYIAAVGRNSKGNFLGVTWGGLQAMEPDWLRSCMVGGIVYIPTAQASQALLDDYHQITGA